MTGFPTATTTRRRGRWGGWSFSKLEGWRTCPKQHYHKSIAKDVKEEPSEHQKYGDLVHKMLAKRIMHGEPIQEYHAPLLEPWAAKVLNGYPNAAACEAAGRGRILCENQLAMCEDFSPCEWFDNNRAVWGRGIVDVMKVNGPVGFQIDWKTGRVKPDSDQLLISAQLMFSHFPEVQVIRTMFVWLKEDAETVLDVRREHMPELWSRLNPEILRYRQAVEKMDFPAKPNGLCGRYCPVRSCEHNGAV